MRRAAVIVRGPRPCAGRREWPQLREIRRIVAHCRPSGVGAGDGEGCVERETGLDCRIRLVQPTKVREGGGQQEIWCRIISVGLDRPSEPPGCLLKTAQSGLRDASETLPGMGIRIARTEAQGLANVSLRLFGATDKNLTKSDKGVGAGEISIQLQRTFTFGDALLPRAWSIYRQTPSNMWPRAWSGTDDKALVNFASAAAKAAIGSVTKKFAPSPRPRGPIQ